MLKRNYGLVHVSSIKLNDFLKSKGFNPLTNNELDEIGENKVVDQNVWIYTYSDSIRKSITQYENNILKF